MIAIVKAQVECEANGRGAFSVPQAFGGRAGLSGTNMVKGATHNRRMILHAVRMVGTVPRSHLSEITGLTLPAISAITNRLLAEGLLLKAGRTQGGRGQPAVHLVLNPDGAFGIGFGIDRDHLTFVAMDFAGRVRFRHHAEIQFATPSAALHFFRDAFRTLRDRQAIDMNRVIGIGIAVPDDLGGLCLPDQPRAYRHWGRRNVAAFAPQYFDGPVFVENDAAAAAIGEMEFGLGLKRSSFLYTLISAGLGGGLVLNGQYFEGAHKRSGEIGYLPMKDRTTGQPDGTTLGDRVLLVHLYERLNAAGSPAATPEDLYQLCPVGLDIVRQWVDESAAALCDTFVQTACLVNPQSIVIGGRLPRHLALQLCENLTRRLDGMRGQIRWLPTIEPAHLYVDAAAVGAAVLPIRDQFVTGVGPSTIALVAMAEAQ